MSGYRYLQKIIEHPPFVLQVHPQDLSKLLKKETITIKDI